MSFGDDKIHVGVDIEAYCFLAAEGFREAARLEVEAEKRLDDVSYGDIGALQ